MAGIDKNTVLMLHMNDDTFKDECGNTVINNGVTLDTNNKVFGDGSALFNAISDDIVIPCTPILNLGGSNKDFTIDFWANCKAMLNNSAIVFFTNSVGGGLNENLYISVEEGTFRMYYIDINSKLTLIDSSTILQYNIWYHLAVSKKDNNLFIFVNGKLKSSVQVNTLRSNTQNYNIGSWNQNYDGSFSGNIDEFRISNIARWTEDFIPPTREYSRYDYLIKQQNKYYSIKDDNMVELGIPEDNTQLEEWFNTYGIFDINQLCKKYNIESFVSQGEVLGNGKLFTFDIPSNMKNINNVD